MIKQNLPAIWGIDTRQLTHAIRDGGAPHVALSHNSKGKFDLPALCEEAKVWKGLEGNDLAGKVSCAKPYEWSGQSLWRLESGYAKGSGKGYHIVAIDYGMKLNILRHLAEHGCKITVVPASMPAKDILAYKPDGIFLSNGPGDPAATGEYAVPILKDLIASGIPIFGICLGHQILALALGGKTRKMDVGHRGANQPVKDFLSDGVEITSQNHGFVVHKSSLPSPDAWFSHKSLFDDSVEGLGMTNKHVFSVQYHPEASPGPHDSQYLFKRFMDNITAHKRGFVPVYSKDLSYGIFT